MRRRAAPGAILAILLASTAADAQPRPPVRPFPPSPPQTQPAPPATAGPAAHGASGTDLRARFGTEVATRLMRSSDADDRLRGVERAAATRTPEALALLARAASAGSPGGFDPRAPIDGVARNDPRALLAVVRGLASRVDREQAQTALATILGASAQAFAKHPASSRDAAADDIEGEARIRLAREQSAIALASSGSASAIDSLVAVARSGGPGQEAALEALVTFPPTTPVLGGVALTTPGMVELAARVGDLRSLDAVKASARTGDALLRAAAIAALGDAGDQRGVEIATAALHDADARVRIAAAQALARLGSGDAARAVESLVADDATALAGLVLAREVRSEGIVRAAAARAVASANAETRAAAVAALGRQTSEAAIGALAALIADPAIQGDVAAAIARSPSRAAMASIERMAIVAPTRRLAARAYFVRRFERDERNPRLDAVLAALSASADARDRAAGIMALVALGEQPLDRSLADGDARVRRAAALGSMARLDTTGCAALRDRLAVETDEATRVVLGVALVSPEGDAYTTTRLVERAQSGAADAPMAAMALARRSGDDVAARVDSLLSSRDPVLRAHAARGLGASASPDVSGRLARAYEWEADAGVRRAIVEALAARGGGDADSPSRREVLTLASRLDPDATVRFVAARALAGAPSLARADARRVAWLRVVPAQGARPLRDPTATLVRADGLSVPIAFDDDGYALVPGVPPGEARIELAPGLPAYEAAPP